MDGAEAGEGGTRSILRSYVRSQALAGDRARREKRPAGPRPALSLILPSLYGTTNNAGSRIAPPAQRL
jgi:hypothetical protein